MKEDIKEEKCENCKHWDKNETYYTSIGHNKDYHPCKRYPEPVTVHKTNFCGEFKKIKK